MFLLRSDIPQMLNALLDTQSNVARGFFVSPESSLMSMTLFRYNSDARLALLVAVNWSEGYVATIRGPPGKAP
eukprot:scaffold298501_cov18-Prasinocladus_malaysianus.AAC.1